MKLTDRKRHQIILAAVKEFRDNGFTGTSMDNVAQCAAVSKRTVYNHFDSKDALFGGILEYMFGLVAETAPEPYDTNRPLEGQLKDIAKAKVDLFSSEEFLDLSRVTLPESIHNPEKMKQAIEQIAVIESGIERWFTAAIADNQLVLTSATEACEEFMGLVKMEAFWPHLIKGKPSPMESEKARMVDKVVGMFLCCYQNDTIAVRR